VIALTILFATLVGEAIVLRGPGKARSRSARSPWSGGLLLTPTFLVWTTFVGAVFALTASRYCHRTRSGLAVDGAQRLHAGAQPHELGVQLGPVERHALERHQRVRARSRCRSFSNRIVVLGLTALFIALTVRCFPRTRPTAPARSTGLRPAALFAGLVAFLPFLVVPARARARCCGSRCSRVIRVGAAKKRIKDYYRANYATVGLRDAAQIAHARCSISCSIHRSGGLEMNGEYDLTNPLPNDALRAAAHGRRDVGLTPLDDERQALHAEDHAKLVRVHAASDRWRRATTSVIGFRFRGRVPGGISKNGAGSMEYVAALVGSCSRASRARRCCRSSAW
jgi:hypothetical protein